MKKLIVIFFLFGVAAGQTRIYMSGLAPSFSVTPRAIWVKLGASYPNNIFLLSRGYPLGVVSATLITAADSTYTGFPHYMEAMQLVTYPLLAQTLNGTVHIQIRASKSTASSTLQPFGFIVIRLINPDGSVASEIDTLNSPQLMQSAATTNYPFDYTFNNVSINAGQRICFEFGARIDRTVNTSTERYANTYLLNTADLPNDNTTTTNLNSWIEFSQILKWQYPTNHFF